MSDLPQSDLPRRKKKACQRCRHRKQRCDFEQPCHNCTTAGVACLPVAQGSFQSYPTGYVPALENHAAMLERSLNSQFPGTAADHLEPMELYSVAGQALNLAEEYPAHASELDPSFSPTAQGTRQLQQAQTHNPDLLTGRISFRRDSIVQNNVGSIVSPPSLEVQASPTSSRATQSPKTVESTTQVEGMNDVPVLVAASFFRTYFQSIHPQYPFLSIQECGEWYTEWKLAGSGVSLSAWPAFFVKMIFAIGALIQTKSDNAPMYQHQDLKAQAQSEDIIIRSTKSSPLRRLQGMLLSAMHALHSESTARISHISGAIMRFASLHGFHRLVDTGTEESNMKKKVWSCAYILDRAISGTLDLPVSLSDRYISSSLYIECLEQPASMPWLDDLPHSDSLNGVPTLATFAHICKIRLVQSFILDTMQAVPFEGSEATPEWQESMRIEIDNWTSGIDSHSLMNTEGYQSPLWLSLISNISRLLLCRPSKANINTYISDMAFQASCGCCTTFRKLQKKRQIAQPWLVVITQFQAGVTILYIIWARAVIVPKEADIAIRDCTAVLAILADRWQNAEHYRDCFEVLARAVPRCEKLGYLERDVREELTELIEKVQEAGIHRHVRNMLEDMASCGNEIMDVEWMN